MKIVNIDRGNLHIFLRNFNEIYSKDVTYHNIKRHKKLGLHLVSRVDPLPPSLLRVKLIVLLSRSS